MNEHKYIELLDDCIKKEIRIQENMYKKIDVIYDDLCKNSYNQDIEKLYNNIKPLITYKKMISVENINHFVLLLMKKMDKEFLKGNEKKNIIIQTLKKYIIENIILEKRF